jgi:hypothetical protein
MKFLLLVYYIQLISAGHIFSWDPIVKYDVNALPEKIDLPFMLESGLPKNGIIHLKLPFSASSIFYAKYYNGYDE